jgi:hypothetical protein
MAQAAPMIVSMLGTAASAYAQDRALRKEDRIAAQGIDRQMERQRDADRRMGAEMAALERSDPAAGRDAAQQQFMAQLQRSRTAAAGAMPSVPGASSRYRDDVARHTADSDAQTARLAEIMARIDAPLEQRRQEGQGIGRAGVDLSQIERGAAGDHWLNELRRRAVRPNPWLMAGGQVAQGVSRGMADAAGAAGTPVQTSVLTSPNWRVA